MGWSWSWRWSWRWRELGKNQGSRTERAGGAAAVAAESAAAAYGSPLLRRRRNLRWINLALGGKRDSEWPESAHKAADVVQGARAANSLKMAAGIRCSVV